MMITGRPVEYKPEYCKELLDLGEKEILSKSMIAYHFRKSRTTIYKWMKDNPEFNDAVNTVLAWGQGQYEKLLVRGMKKEIKMDSTVAAIYGNNVCGYRNGKEDGGNTINIGNMNVLQALSTDELLKKVTGSKVFNTLLTSKAQELCYEEKDTPTHEEEG